MDSRGIRTGRLRAVTAVVALYALFLQAFLGGLLPVSATGHAGIICSGSIDSGDAGGAPADTDPHHHPACCTAANVVIGVAQPVLDASAVVWPLRASAAIVWRNDGPGAARGPPGSIAHPRGPPTV